MLPNSRKSKIVKVGVDEVEDITLGGECPTEDMTDILCSAKPKDVNMCYSDVKDVMKDLGMFKSGRLSGLKDDLNQLKTTLKLEEKLGKLVQLTANHLEKSDVMLVVLQIVEDTIYSVDKDTMNKKKLDVAKKVLMPMMGLDEKSLGVMIGLACKQLKKTTFWRRNKHRLMRLLSFFCVKA